MDRTVELGPLYVFPSIDRNTFIELMGNLITHYIDKDCTKVEVVMQGKKDTVSFVIDKDEEFKQLTDIPFAINIIENNAVKSQHLDTKLIFKYREEDKTMFLESDFYSKHKKELEDAIKEIDYHDDCLEFLTDFQLSFYETKLKVDGKGYWDVMKNLGAKEEFVSDFLLSYQYFLSIISRIALNLHYNIHTIKNREELERFIISHFDGSFPRYPQV